MIAELLLTHHEYEYAEKILTKVSQRANKNLFHHIQEEEAALLLRQVYAQQGEVRKLARQEAQVAQIQKVSHRITQAIGWHEHLTLQISQSISLSPEIAKQATEKAELLAEWRRGIDHSLLVYYHQCIETIGHVHAAFVIAIIS